MTGLAATLEIYRRAFMRAAVLAVRNWPVMISVFAYAGILLVATQFAALLGLVGGFLMTIVQAACTASFLYLVEMIVRTQRVTLDDFRRSFTVYLWDVIGVMFVLWLVFGILGPMVRGAPNGALVMSAVSLVFLVFFNAVPELIYLGHNSTMALLAESYRFVADNWIEWFPPNILLFGALVGLSSLPAAGVAGLAQAAALALFVYFAMVLRGLLFTELHGTTRRSRIFRYRMGR